MRVLVVGGGIAGFGAALFLRRLGHAVTVVERQRGLIDKVCGEGMLPFGVALLRELGLEQAVAAAGRPFEGVAYACGRYRAEGSFREGCYGIGIGRADLDRVLRTAARQQGVVLEEGVRIVPGASHGYERVVAADGILSPWGAHYGFRKRQSKRLGVRFRLAVEAPARVTVHFLKGMEIYLTPTAAQTLSVAFLLDPQRLGLKGGALRNACIARFREHFPEYDGLEVTEIASRGPIASGPLTQPPALHLVGDAAMAFDPISGAGMSFALLCGKLAARHIDDPAAYWAALARHRRAIGAFTNLVLALRGGGIVSQLMVRQLARAPASFNRILALHNGESGLLDLGPGYSLALLRP